MFVEEIARGNRTGRYQREKIDEESLSYKYKLKEPVKKTWFGLHKY